MPSPAREAHRDKCAEYMWEVRASGRLLQTLPVTHGTNYCYNVGCRCSDCRAAKAATSRASRARIRRSENQLPSA